MHLRSKAKPHAIKFEPTPRLRIRGAVLLEVVLALVIFVAAAAIIGSGLNASVNGVERLRLNAHATDLAVSVLSELQIGIRSLAATGPEPFEAPFEKWTWQLEASPLGEKAGDQNDYQNVEVIIRHDDPPAVFRLSQVIHLEGASSGVEGSSPLFLAPF